MLRSTSVVMIRIPALRIDHDVAGQQADVVAVDRLEVAVLLIGERLDWRGVDRPRRRPTILRRPPSQEDPEFSDDRLTGPGRRRDQHRRSARQRTHRVNLERVERVRERAPENQQPGRDEPRSTAMSTLCGLTSPGYSLRGRNQTPRCDRALRGTRSISHLGKRLFKRSGLLLDPVGLDGSELTVRTGAWRCRWLVGGKV